MCLYMYVICFNATVDTVAEAVYICVVFCCRFSITYVAEEVKNPRRYITTFTNLIFSTCCNTYNSNSVDEAKTKFPAFWNRFYTICD